MLGGSGWSGELGQRRRSGLLSRETPGELARSKDAMLDEISLEPGEPAPVVTVAQIGHGVESLEAVAALIDAADNWLDLKRLELTVYVDNAPAIGLYRKFGFEVEGTRRADAFRDGKFVDSLMMARVRGA